MKMNHLVLFVASTIMSISLDSSALAQGLCPGSNTAPEKNGILGTLQQVGKLIPTANAGTKLGLVDLEAQGVCQYWIYLLDKRQKLIFADVQGTVRLTASVPMS